MKRIQTLAAVGAIAALLLLILTLRQVSALREEVEGLHDRLSRMEQGLADEISGIDNAVRRTLEAQGSLFSDAATQLDYRDGALVLTASVLPKEVGADEVLTLSAGGVSAPMAAGADGTYTGTLTLPLVQELTPTVAFTSPAGTRQEALDYLWTGDMLTVDGESTYDAAEDGTAAVYVGLNPYGDGPVEGRADVASLTLRVVDAPTGIQLGEIGMEPVNPPDQGTSTGSTASAVNLDALWYSADISEYVREKPYDLELWAVLTTAGGLELTDSGPAVTLHAEEGREGGSSGDLSLSPAWAE